jgi:hypothetical protein
MEMDLISTMDRLISQRHKLPITELFPKKNEEVQEYIFDILDKEKDSLQKNKYFRFVEDTGLSLEDIEIIIKETKRRMGVDYLVCTIDLITMISDFNSSSKKADDYENSLNKLHEIVRRNNIHIVGIVQVRRPQEKVKVSSIKDIEKFRPRIEEIKNSSAFEERSRVILGTFRKKHYVMRLLPGCPEIDYMDDILEVSILKQNMGALKTLNYLFNPQNFSITPFKD